MDAHLTIEGMTCQHCVAAVERALQALPGVTAAAVSLEQKSARVSGTFDPVDLLEAVREEGYEARLA